MTDDTNLRMWIEHKKLLIGGILITCVSTQEVIKSDIVLIKSGLILHKIRRKMEVGTS